MMRMTDDNRAAAPERKSVSGAVEPVLTATRDTRDLVVYLHRAVKLTDRELEKVTGAHRVTISRWRSGKTTPRHTGRLDDLRVIVGLLVNSGAFDAEEAGRFLRNRDESLGQRAPLTFLGHTEDEKQRKQEFDRVLRVTQTLVDQFVVTNNPAFAGSPQFSSATSS